MKLIITESQYKLLGNHILNPKKRLVITESQYNKLLLEMVNVPLNDLYSKIKVGNVIVFESNLNKKLVKDSFEVMFNYDGEMLLKKLKDGRYEKNIFYMKEEDLLSSINSNKVNLMISLKDKIDVSKLTIDEIYDKVGDPSLWRKHGVNNIDKVYSYKTENDFNSGKNVMHAFYLSGKKNEDIKVGEITSRFKNGVNNYIKPSSKYVLDFSDGSHLTFVIAGNENGKLLIEFIGENSVVNADTYKGGYASSIIKFINNVGLDVIDKVIIDFNRFKYHMINKSEEGLKLFDCFNDEYDVVNDVDGKIVSLDGINMRIELKDVNAGLIRNVGTNKPSIKIVKKVINDVISLSELDDDANIVLKIKDLKNVGWDNETIRDLLYKKPDMFAKIFGLGASGTIATEKILNKWGLSSSNDVSEDERLKNGANVSFELTEVVRVNNKVEYEQFLKLLKNNKEGKAKVKSVQNYGTSLLVNFPSNYRLLINKKIDDNSYVVNLKRTHSSTVIATLNINIK